MSDTTAVSSTGKRILNMTYIAMFAALMAVCAWIAVPIATIPITLQTFGVFCAVGLLGGKRGTLAILVYILLGAIGVPVFAGFQAGVGVLFGATGGYIIGFVCTALVYWLITGLLGKKWWTMLLGMVAGLFVCYAFGTAWFMVVYTQKAAIGLSAALGMCVIPYIIPDLVKIAAAMLLCQTVSRHVRIFD